eukprot:c5671_g1_i1 orf=80-244(+)
MDHIRVLLQPHYQHTNTNLVSNVMGLAPVVAGLDGSSRSMRLAIRWDDSLAIEL